jgi:hypothetical protein
MHHLLKSWLHQGRTTSKEEQLFGGFTMSFISGSFGTHSGELHN